MKLICASQRALYCLPVEHGPGESVVILHSLRNVRKNFESETGALCCYVVLSHLINNSSGLGDKQF